MDASAPSGGYGPYHSRGEKALSPYLGADRIVWGRIMNVRKLQKLKRYILAEPRRYYQSYWIVRARRGVESIVTEQNPPCGTVACLAGNACLMEGFKPWGTENYIRRAHGRKRLEPGNEAQRILGLSEAQSDDFFRYDGSGWSRRAYRAYREATSPWARAQAAAMAIDDLIATNTRKKPAAKSKH